MNLIIEVAIGLSLCFKKLLKSKVKKNRKEQDLFCPRDELKDRAQSKT